MASSNMWGIGGLYLVWTMALKM